MTKRGHNVYYTSKPLYADDSYIREFRANVIKAGPRFVVLDRTAFYPESGGQPSDTGTLNVEGVAYPVRKVMKRGRDIFHYIDGNIPLASSVHGVIDWEPRFYNMRRHSAEHLLTGLFERVGSGPKVYSDLTRLEFKPSDLLAETLNQVETEFNDVVDENIPIRIYYISREELEYENDERKRGFLDKIPRTTDNLRMVEIPGHALTFCFGTHVDGTREIGHLSSMTFQEGRKKSRRITFTLVD
jgi:misacylated tRNA(Ala) deacylase